MSKTEATVVARESRGLLVVDTPLLREYAIRDGWIQRWARKDEKDDFAYVGEFEVED